VAKPQLHLRRLIVRFRGSDWLNFRTSRWRTDRFVASQANCPIWGSDWPKSRTNRSRTYRKIVTVIEIRLDRWGWKVFESPDVEPVFQEKHQAINYAQERASFRSGETRILDSTGNIERAIPFSEVRIRERLVPLRNGIKLFRTRLSRSTYKLCTSE
jgi:hypothetical protein